MRLPGRTRCHFLSRRVLSSRKVRGLSGMLESPGGCPVRAPCGAHLSALLTSGRGLRLEVTVGVPPQRLKRTLLGGEGSLT